jgi:hypothetical protein
MKKTKNCRRFIYAVFIVGFIGLTRASAQEVQLQATIGYPELSVAGLRFAQGHTRWGVSAGASRDFTQLSGSMAWHFAGRTWKGSQPSWYLAQYLHYRKQRTETLDSSTRIAADLRVGYAYFPLSWLGIQAELGPSVPLWEDQYYHGYHNDAVSDKGHLILEPGMSLSLLFRLSKGKTP